MADEGNDLRQEHRFQLRGAFNNAFFALGSRTVAVEPLDVSRNGLGLLIDDAWEYDDIASLHIIFLENQAPITLELRYKRHERNSRGLHARTRCGLELSEDDKRRGIDLIQLLQSTNSALQLICA